MTGEDWIAETGADVIEVIALEYSKQTELLVKLVLAVPRESAITAPKNPSAT